MDYKVEGRQILSVVLKAGEKIYADPGKLVGKSASIRMTPKMTGGIMQAISRKMAGTAMMLTEFEAVGEPGILSLAGVLPGKVEAITLGDGEQFVAEHFAFLAAEGNINFTVEAVSIGAAFFGGAGLILQRFKGPGTIFIQVVGDTIEYELDGTKDMEVDPGHIAGFDSALTYHIRFIDNIRSILFAKEGIFLATFKGKGKLMLHSVSRFKLSSTIFKEGEEETQKG